MNQPWEKLRLVGPEGAKNEELLAIVLRDGSMTFSPAILRDHPVEQLITMPRDKLTKIKGIGIRKADTLLAAFELARRGLGQGLGIMPSISRPTDVLPIIADIRDKKKEYFLAVFLNARNQVICREDVAIGSLNASLVHPREVFFPAVGSSAASIILAHNHPSGDVTPSAEDIGLTRRISQAGEILGIEVLDHIVVASEKFLSLKEAELF